MRIVDKYKKILDKYQQRKVFVLVLMMILAAFLEAIGVGLMVPLMTAIMDENCLNEAGLISSVCKIIGIYNYKSLIIVCLVALIFLYVVKDLYVIYETRVLYKFMYNQKLRTQRQILNAYISRPYEFYLNTSFAEITKVINSDVTETYTLLSSLMTLLSESIVAIVMMVTVTIISPIMTLMVTTVMAICMLAIVTWIKPQMKQSGEDLRLYHMLFSRWLFQSIQGIKEVKVTQTESFFETMFEKNGQKFIDAQRKDQVWAIIPRMIIEMVSITTALCAIVVMVFNGNSMKVLMPVITAFAMAAVKLLPSANRIVSAANDIAIHEPALDELIVELDELDKRVKASDEKSRQLEMAYFSANQNYKISVPQRQVELADITYQYPLSDKEVLSNANMLIPVGTSVGIVGTSGAGKSTAVDVLLGLLNPNKGHVLCDGKDVMNDYTSWLANIGYIPQSIFLLDSDIRENVAFGVPRNQIDDSAVWEALEKAQLADFVKTLPNGIYNTTGEGGIRLSGGQRQRIGVARALYNNPPILVFDEATSALDNETESAIMESINSLHGIKTIVIIAHRLSTIEECDIVYRVEAGQIFRER